MQEEKRFFRRIEFPATVEVSSPAGSAVGRLRDLSLNGALVRFSEPPLFVDEQPVNLEITLAAADLQLQMMANCVHRLSNDLGFRFIGVELETMGHLRRLLELNTGDSGRVRRELDFLLEK